MKIIDRYTEGRALVVLEERDKAEYWDRRYEFYKNTIKSAIITVISSIFASTAFLGYVNSRKLSYDECRNEVRDIKELASKSMIDTILSVPYNLGHEINCPRPYKENIDSIFE